MLTVMFILYCFLSFLPTWGMNQRITQPVSSVVPLTKEHLKKLPAFFCSDDDSNIYLHGEVTTHVLGWSLKHASYVILDGDKVTGFGNGFFADKKSWFDLYDGGKVGLIKELKFDPQCKTRGEDRELFGKLVQFFKDKQAEKVVSYAPLARNLKYYLIKEGFSEKYAMKYQTRFEKNNELSNNE